MAQQLSTAVTGEEQPVSRGDTMRAGVYALLAALLRTIPEASLLSQVRDLAPAEGRDGLALAWESLRLAACHVTPEAVDDEYHALFIGLGRGELIPFGSWYQTGFLMERPLGLLRRDLANLGFERQEGVHEPEDHVAALCEVMAELALDTEVPFARQRTFFATHLAPWAARFFRDLARAESAVFYKAVAGLGDAFFALERRYLDLEA